MYFSANPLGIMLTNILSPLLAQTASREDMLLMVSLAFYGIIVLMWNANFRCAFQLGVQCIPAVIAVVMATFGWWSNRPPTPPSASAETDSERFIVGLKMLLRNPPYYILATAVGAGIGLFSVLTTLLSQILCPWGYTDVSNPFGLILMYISLWVTKKFRCVYSYCTGMFKNVYGHNSRF